MDRAIGCHRYRSIAVGAAGTLQYVTSWDLLHLHGLAKPHGSRQPPSLPTARLNGHPGTVQAMRVSVRGP